MELLTIQETADILRVSPVTVRRFIKSKRLPAVRVGRGLRVRREDVERIPEAVGQGNRAKTEPDRTWGLFTEDDPLWDLVGMFEDDAEDVSSDKYKYLAEAYADLHDNE